MRNMKKFLLTLKYNGSGFVGWQVQKNGLAVQTCLQNALETLLGHRPDVTGCSRTDSGVHALGYCAVFVSETDRECDKILRGLNALLPDSVSVTACREVDMEFHPRYDAVAKEYVYRLYDGPPDPFNKGLAWHCKRALDAERMQRAASHFVGEHDFRSFMASGSSITDTVRRIHWFRIRRKEDGMIEIRICGNGFLYNMVRILVGTLVDVCAGRLREDEMERVLSALDRSAAGPTAPAEGLYLARVFYDQKEMEGYDGT